MTLYGRRGLSSSLSWSLSLACAGLRCLSATGLPLVDSSRLVVVNTCASVREIVAKSQRAQPPRMSERLRCPNGAVSAVKLVLEVRSPEFDASRSQPASAEDITRHLLCPHQATVARHALLRWRKADSAFAALFFTSSSDRTAALEIRSYDAAVQVARKAAWSMQESKQNKHQRERLFLEQWSYHLFTLTSVSQWCMHQYVLLWCPAVDCGGMDVP